MVMRVAGSLTNVRNAARTLILVLLFPSLCLAHAGGMTVPIEELSDQDLESIDLTDGSLDDWATGLLPALTSGDFAVLPGVGDAAPYNHSDLDFSIWLGWHGDRVYVAIERVDDVYVNESGDISQQDHIEFMTDGDHSGGSYLSPEESYTAQQYVGIAEIDVGSRIQLGITGLEWLEETPFSVSGGNTAGSNPSVSVLEFYVTPYDELTPSDPLDSLNASVLANGQIIGFHMSVVDVDDSPGQIHAFHSLAGQQDTHESPDHWVDGLLVSAEPPGVPDPTELPDSVLAAVSVADNAILLLDPTTGDEVSRYATPVVAVGDAGLAYDGERLYFVNGDGSNVIFQLDPATGGILQSTVVDAPAITGLAHSGLRLYGLSTSASTIYEISASDGDIISEIFLDGLVDGGLAYAGLRATLLVGMNQSVVEIAPSDGTILSSVPVPFTPTTGIGYSIAFGLALVSNQQWVYGIDLDTGSLSFAHPLPAGSGLAADEVPVGVAPLVINQTTQLSGVTDMVGPYVIRSTVTSNATLEAVVLWWYTGEDTVQTEMVPEGAGSYRAEIPAQLWGTRVYYYVTATDQQGHIARDPPVWSYSSGISGLFAYLIRVTAADSSQTSLMLGLRSDATKGFDPEIEPELDSPPPPLDRFDVRFKVSGTDGTTMDWRPRTAVGTDGEIWEIVLQSGSAGLPLEVSWESVGWDPPGRFRSQIGFRIRDAATAGAQLDVDMTTQTSVLIEDLSIDRLQVLYIIHPESHAYDLPAGWSLISNPMRDSVPVASVFADVISTFAFSNGYEPVEELIPCRGYWVNLAQGGSYTVNGVFNESCETTLTGGWGLIGVPSDILATGEFSTGASLILSLFSYGGLQGYQQVSHFSAGQGLWVNMAAPGVLRSQTDIPTTIIFRPKPVSPPPPRATSVLWAASREARQELQLGVFYDEFPELPPAPPADLLDLRAIVGGKATQWVPLVHEGARHRVHLQGSDPLLGWHLGPEPTRWSLSVDGVEHLLEGSGSLRIGSPLAEIFLHQAALPHRAELTGNYPNPFNPSTTIGFGLNYPAHVSLTVYNLAGQRVRELVDGFWYAGLHSVAWDGRDEVGHEVASGIYLCELRTGKAQTVRKMALMK